MADPRSTATPTPGGNDMMGGGGVALGAGETFCVKLQWSGWAPGGFVMVMLPGLVSSWWWYQGWCVRHSQTVWYNGGKLVGHPGLHTSQLVQILDQQWVLLRSRMTTLLVSHGNHGLPWQHCQAPLVTIRTTAITTGPHHNWTRYWTRDAQAFITTGPDIGPETRKPSSQLDQILDQRRTSLHHNWTRYWTRDAQAFITTGPDIGPETCKPSSQLDQILDQRRASLHHNWTRYWTRDVQAFITTGPDIGPETCKPSSQLDQILDQRRASLHHNWTRYWTRDVQAFSTTGPDIGPETRRPLSQLDQILDQRRTGPRHSCSRDVIGLPLLHYCDGPRVCTYIIHTWKYMEQLQCNELCTSLTTYIEWPEPMGHVQIHWDCVCTVCRGQL